MGQPPPEVARRLPTAPDRGWVSFAIGFVREQGADALHPKERYPVWWGAYIAGRSILGAYMKACPYFYLETQTMDPPPVPVGLPSSRASGEPAKGSHA